MSGGGRRLPIVSDPAAGPAPGFQRVAIVGLGAVGGSLALAIRRARPATLVIGVDTHAVIEAAIRMHAIDVGAADLMIAADADLVVLAGGADDNRRVMPFLADAIPGAATVLALAGVPAPFESPWLLPERLALVVAAIAAEGRPGGIRAANADLLRGVRWRLAPISAGGTEMDRLRDLVRAVGGEPVDGAARADDGTSGRDA